MLFGGCVLLLNKAKVLVVCQVLPTHYPSLYSHCCLIAKSISTTPTPKHPFHLFLAGLVAVGMSCVLLLDEAQHEETPQCIQCVAATMSVINPATQESMYDSGFDDSNDLEGSEMKRAKYFHWRKEQAKQNIQQDYLCTNPIFNKTGFHQSFQISHCVYNLRLGH